MAFLLVIAGVVFLLGLVQWARSGAILWDVHRLLHHGAPPDAEDKEERLRGETRKESLKKSVQSMEMTMDGLLRSSFKLLGILALCVWIFVVFSVIADMMGLDWLDRLSFSANRVLGSPTVRASNRPTGFNFNRNTGTTATGGSAVRSERFRSLGSGVRR